MSKFKRIFRILLADLVMLVFSLFASAILTNMWHGKPVSDLGTVSNSLKCFPLIIAVTLFCYSVFGLYNILWRFAAVRETMCIVAANATAGAGFVLLHFFFKYVWKINNFYFLDAFQIILLVIFITALSFLIRMVIKYAAEEEKKRKHSGERTDIASSVMIIGAGSAGELIVREFILNDALRNVKCFIDDDDKKLGTNIHGIKVVGNSSMIADAVKKYDIEEIIVAIPSMDTGERAELLEKCKRCCKSVKTVPELSDIVDGRVRLSSLREINVEDLLQREPIRTDIDDIMNYVSGKTVLVTGGGGSIGSELCRQIASYSPKKLVIVDIYENNAYEIQQELLRNYPDLDLSVIIASVRDTQRLYNVFDQYRPDLVYHAAAHKHVPLMENNSHEAIKNNVFGTLKTVMAASAYGVKRFVMISTDKAVNPTNIMGASKRICEMIIQSYNKRSKTEFVAVRFGNVLGSNGSVIPLFKKQIEEGGPVTVTHPDIIRYFMTIPEAVSLVLQAGALAKGGEIFILNMGKPVKILDLAENVIRLSGYTPYKDIDIKFTGLRPGEKLYEELLMSEEGLRETENKLIFVGKPIEFDDEEFFRKIENLSLLLGDESSDIRAAVADIVPTYKYKKEEE